MLIRAFVRCKKCLISDKISSFPRHPINGCRKPYSRSIEWDIWYRQQQVVSHRLVRHCKPVLSPVEVQFVTPAYLCYNNLAIARTQNGEEQDNTSFILQIKTLIILNLTTQYKSFNVALLNPRHPLKVWIAVRFLRALPRFKTLNSNQNPLLKRDP